jgi:3'-phosphoadenosine 5'-phosphosulfate sulfotransferase (PAPS reductase)/FAD synthetase
MKILVQFSGGKDSLASLIWAKEKFGNNIIAVFCDTKWEHEDTYKHINQVIEKIGVELITLTSKKHDGFVDMAVNKKRFPSTKARFCTEELKVKPFIDYILDLSEDVIIIQGIRSDESLSRSKMEAECSFFKYYFEPYGNDKNGKPKTYSYRKKEIEKFVSKYTNDVIRPIFTWSAENVFEYIHSNGFEANPLYKRGFGRVGCMPCIMARKSELKAILENEPEYFDRILEAEKKVGRTFFPPKYIPNHATTNGQFPEASDVKKYIEGQNETIELFPKNNKCSSYYSLCE